ncbi:MAG: UDP-N-acetylglucosamine--N-acetylmuramyl-(pentapeptide) pyrophosphoryl-undecaprenol N-acetylglucosamine transferase, partial [Clostridia bacterium]|nr:UDP-N-acetylglucosamine--N-acetylmuramyl-(pentapeptide) pyrophosphoryl-undecaprenol N-acetylglucosamine transferase [Clostridia bacterium]
IYDMPRQMTAADLVISRAGAITLAELSLLGKPAILIPSPNVTDNHQYKNAAVFRDRGAAVLIEEKDLTPELLQETVQDLISHPEKLAEMSRRMKTLAVPGSSDLIWEEVRKLVRR